MDTSTIKNEQPSPSNEPTLDEKEHIRLERIVRVGINRLVDRIQNAEIALSGAEVEIEINRISKETGVSTKSLVSTLKKQTGGNAKDQKPQATKPAAEQPEVDEETKRNADEAFNKLQNHSNLFGVFQKHLRFAGYIANRHLADGLLMSHGARLLPKPTTFATTGEPGSGKSDCFDVGGEFLPPECVLRFTTCSAKALLYLGDISHRVLLLGEMNLQAIRLCEKYHPSKAGLWRCMW